MDETKDFVISMQFVQINRMLKSFSGLAKVLGKNNIAHADKLNAYIDGEIRLRDKLYQDLKERK